MCCLAHSLGGIKERSVDLLERSLQSHEVQPGLWQTKVSTLFRGFLYLKPESIRGMGGVFVIDKFVYYHPM